MKAKITNISSDTLYIPSFYRSLAPGESIVAERTVEQVNTDTVVRTYLADATISLEWVVEPNDGTVSPINNVGDIVIYMDAVNGDDTNDGLTRSTAIRTVARRIGALPYTSPLVPSEHNAKARTVMLPGTYVWPSPQKAGAKSAAYSTSKAVGPLAEPEGWVADSFTTIVPIGGGNWANLAGSSKRTILVADTTGMLEGDFVKFLTGPNAGQTLSVESVGVGTFNLLYGTLSVPSGGGGDQFTTFRPNVDILVSDPAGASLFGNGAIDAGTAFNASLQFVGIRLHVTSGPPPGLSFRTGGFAFDRCELRVDGSVAAFRQFSTGMFGVNVLPDLVDPLNRAGTYVHSVGVTGGSLVVTQNSELFGAAPGVANGGGFIERDVVLFGHNDAQISTNKCFATRCGLLVDEAQISVAGPASVNKSIFTGYDSTFQYQVDQFLASSPTLASVEERSKLQLQFVDFSNNACTAVVACASAAGGGTVGSTVETFGVTGTANNVGGVGVGFSLKGTGNALSIDPTTSLSGNAAGDDVQLDEFGGPVTHTYAAIAAVGAISDVRLNVVSVE